MTDRPARRAAIAICLAAVALYADMYITQPLLPLIGAQFGVAPATAGLSVAAVVLLIALTSGVYGALSDALGRRAVMVGSCALLVLPTLLCALAPSFGWLLLGRAAQGALIPGVIGVAVPALGDLVEPRAIGRVVGVYIAATVLGGLTGRVVSGLVAAALSWRAAFGVFALLTLLAALALRWALPDDRTRRGDPRAAWQTTLAAYRAMFGHLRDRRLVGAFAVGGTLFFAFIGVFTYLPYLLSAPPHQLPTGLIASAYLVYTAGIIASPLAGRLASRIARRWLIIAGLLVAAIGVALTLSHNLAGVIGGLLVLCFGNFTAQAIAPAYVNTTAQGAKGGAGALYLTAYYFGAVLGSYVPGLAWQAAGWPGVVALCIAVQLCGALICWRLCR